MSARMKKKKAHVMQTKKKVIRVKRINMAQLYTD